MDLAQHYLENGTVPPATEKTRFDNLNVLLIFQQGTPDVVSVARAFVDKCRKQGYVNSELFATSSDVQTILAMVPDIVEQLTSSEIAELKMWPYAIFHASPAIWNQLFIVDTPEWSVYHLPGYTSAAAAFVADQQRLLRCLQYPISNVDALTKIDLAEWQIELIEQYTRQNTQRKAWMRTCASKWCSIPLASYHCDTYEWPKPVNNLRLSWRRRVNYFQKYRVTCEQPMPFSAHLELYPAALYNMTNGEHDTSFFRIMAQLPPELRMLIANFAYGNPASFISDANLEAASI